MPYQIGGGGDAAPRARRPERVTYQEERVVRRVSGPRDYVANYSRAENDDYDRPIRVKMVEEPKKGPGFIEKLARNGGQAIALTLGIGGMLAFFWGGFSAIGGSHVIPGIGRLATPGMAPGALMLGGIAAMGAGGVLNHFAKPKA